MGALESPAHLAGFGRVTGPRRAVLDAAAAFQVPFTIEELAATVPDVGRATVFRTVKRLQESGAVCRMMLEDGSVRYQVSLGVEHHHHLICSECGSVREFSDPDLDALIERNAANLGFQLDGHSLELYGRCDACA
jgi:Fe2+ or Zn2+ uptake regulation protein